MASSAAWVVGRRAVEGGGDDLAPDRALHVGDLFGPLVDEDDHEVALRIVASDRVGDVLHDRGLAGLRRRDDQARWPLPIGMIRSMTRVVSRSVVVSSRSRWFG